MEKRICDNCGNTMEFNGEYWLCEWCGYSTKDNSDFKDLGYVG